MYLELNFWVVWYHFNFLRNCQTALQNGYITFLSHKQYMRLQKLSSPHRDPLSPPPLLPFRPSFLGGGFSLLPWLLFLAEPHRYPGMCCCTYPVCLVQSSGAFEMVVQFTSTVVNDVEHVFHGAISIPSF